MYIVARDDLHVTAAATEDSTDHVCVRHRDAAVGIKEIALKRILAVIVELKRMVARDVEEHLVRRQTNEHDHAAELRVVIEVEYHVVCAVRVDGQGGAIVELDAGEVKNAVASGIQHAAGRIDRLVRSVRPKTDRQTSAGLSAQGGGHSVQGIHRRLKGTYAETHTARGDVTGVVAAVLMRVRGRKRDTALDVRGAAVLHVTRSRNADVARDVHVGDLQVVSTRSLIDDHVIGGIAKGKSIGMNQAGSGNHKRADPSQ